MVSAGEGAVVSSWASGRCLPRCAATAVGNPVAMAIVVTTLVGFALRLFGLLHGGRFLAVTEYDDGPYFGSAVRLIQGVLPYRDFVFVQPPGITLIMLPSALLAKVVGTAGGLASGRILTTLAGSASVALTGLLVRHRGLFATLLACGLMAVYPGAVAAAHTVLVEPWLVLFCLLGAVAMFDGDGLARGRRVMLGGLAFGFAGAIEAWAIAPVTILLVLCAVASPSGQHRLCRLARFAAGVAAGFVVPVAAFAAAAPRGFYQSVIVAQIGPRHDASRVALLYRLYELTGLSDVKVAAATLRAQVNLPFVHASWPLAVLVWGATGLLMAIMAGIPALLIITRYQAPTVLGWFALVSAGLVVAMFLWPSQFHYHFAAFLAPFLALAIALPLATIIIPESSAAAPGKSPVGHSRGEAERPHARSGSVPPGQRGSPRWVMFAAATVLTVFAAFQAKAEEYMASVVPAQSIAHADRLIPQGSCVVSDLVSLLLLADRFNPAVPGCVVVDDGRGTDLALSHGLTPETGAGLTPAVAALWRESFHHAQFLWLSYHYQYRIAGSPALWRYMRRHFELIYADRSGDRLYRRVHRWPRPGTVQVTDRHLVKELAFPLPICWLL